MTGTGPGADAAAPPAAPVVPRGRGRTALGLPGPARLLGELALVAGMMADSTWARLGLDHLVGDRVAFITYFPAIILLSRWCSLWVALLGIAAAAALADYWFIGPVGAWSVSLSDLLQLGLFVAVSTWIAFTTRFARVAWRRAEARSRELEAILQALPVGIGIARDPGCRTIQGNEALRRITGMEHAPNVTDGIDGAHPPYRILRDGVDVPADRLPMRIAAREGRSTVAEPLDVLTSGGAFARLLVSAVPLVDDAGRTSGAVGVMMDVTAQRAAEYRLRMALRAGRMVAWGWDPERDAITVSDDVVEVYGLLPGQTIAQANQGFALLLPEDRERHIGTVREALVSGTGYRSRFRIRRPVDGRVIWLDERAELVRDPGGRLQVFGVVVDVTALKEREDALAASETRYRALVDGVPHLIWSSTPDGGLAFVNQAWLDYTGQTRGQALAGFEGIVHPDDLARVLTIWRERLARGEPWQEDYRLRAADGAYRWWQGRSWPVRDAAGALVAWHGIAVDIHERREVEQRLRYLAETMPQLVWIAGPDGRLRWTNRHWVEYVGASVEVSRADGWAVFHADDAPRMFASWQAALRTLEPYGIEVRIRRGSDQRFRWFLVRAVPQVLAGGMVDSWIGTCTDIHELKEAEAALRAAAQRDHEREQRLRLALETGAVGTWDYDPRSGELLADARCKAMFGLAADATPSYAELIACIHPGDRERVEAAVRQALAPGGSGTYDLECRAIGAGDGVLRHLKASGQATFDAQGVPVRLGGTVVDLSGVRRADERDRLQAEAGALLVEGFDVPRVLAAVAELCARRIVDWCGIDLAGEHGAVEQVAVAHRDPARVALAHELRRRYPPTAQSPVAQVLETGRPFLCETVTDAMMAASAIDEEHLRLIRALGLRSVAVVPLRARDRVLGALTLVTAESRRTLRADDLAFAEELGRRIGLAVDNARLFAAEQRARAFAVERAETLGQLNAELEQFAYVCSHDLQEPLRQVLQYLELARLRLGTGIDERTTRYLDYVTESAERMRALILDLLGYARVGQAEAPAEQEVELERVLAEAMENLRGRIAETGATIVSDPLPTVRGDKVQLVQVFQNLLANALKFRGDAPPRIAVGAAGTPEHHLISVADNGIGVPAAQRERIFEVFQRLHPRDRYPGSGIGLAICRKLIARAGGRIWADAAEGGGTVFRFTLPKPGARPPPERVGGVG